MADFVTNLVTVPDGKGHRVYEFGNTVYNDHDTPMDRMLSLNKKKNNSLVMPIIIDEICSTIFKGHIQYLNDRFRLIDVESDDSILLSNNRLKMFSASCDKTFEEYLYQYNGEYIYSYECLKQYEWFSENFAK